MKKILTTLAMLGVLSQQPKISAQTKSPNINKQLTTSLTTPQDSLKHKDPETTLNLNIEWVVSGQGSTTHQPFNPYLGDNADPITIQALDLNATWNTQIWDIQVQGTAWITTWSYKTSFGGNVLPDGTSINNLWWTIKYDKFTFKSWISEYSVIGDVSINPYKQALIIPPQYGVALPWPSLRLWELTYTDMTDTLQNGKAYQFTIWWWVVKESSTAYPSLSSFTTVEWPKGIFYITSMADIHDHKSYNQYMFAYYLDKKTSILYGVTLTNHPDTQSDVQALNAEWKLNPKLYGRVELVHTWADFADQSSYSLLVSWQVQHPISDYITIYLAAQWWLDHNQPTGTLQWWIKFNLNTNPKSKP